MPDFKQELATQITRVFEAHPELEDHRTGHPWMTGSLGDPKSDIWLLAENPSASQVDRIHSAKATPNSQWAASKGDRLLRDALVEHGLKTGEPMASGGWNCYITNAMKSEVVVKDWNGTARERRLAVAEMWAPVLRFEMEYGEPKKLLVLGGNALQAITHMKRNGLIPELPPIEELYHYSYVMMRPDKKNKLGPGDPQRQTDWKRDLGLAAKL